MQVGGEALNYPFNKGDDEKKVHWYGGSLG